MAEEKKDNDKQAKGGSSGKKKSKGKGKGKGKQDETAKYSGVPADYVPRLAQKYADEVAPALTKEFGYKSSMEVPRLEKVVVNMGVGEATGNIKLLEDAMRELTLIAGQKPRMNRATRSVAQFKVREGMPVGCSVTLRGKRMYDFLDRLINVAIPRVRDFRGLPPNSFDGRGNHSLGIREQLIFTEINYSDIEDIRGMNVTTVTTAKTDAECKALLVGLGMPLRKK